MAVVRRVGIIFLLFDVKVLVKVLLGELERHAVLVHEVKGEKLLVLRIDAVGPEAAAEPVPPVVHQGDRLDDHLTPDQFPRTGR